MEIIGGLNSFLHKINFDRDYFDKLNFGKMSCYIKVNNKSIQNYHYYYDEISDTYIIILGKIFDKSLLKSNNIACGLLQIYNENGVKGTSVIDGDFMMLINFESEDLLKIISDKEGTQQIYYKNTSEFIFSSNIEFLLQDFCEEKIDFSSIYDFLNCATVLGNRTFSKEVKFLNGGHVLTLKNKNIKIEKYYEFVYKDILFPIEIWMYIIHL